ncbi:protein lifeguard 2 isoform X1 [Teleopsis dalmanni]|uniref:protein lifeguard 2 isoform X1 n=1 Tax=Teleopsis dalmanni TaxID=139649 RepID=UPI0018CF2A05|nr:protein lifeguard 2 isoform X1 [Teleopsis dalmanni]
MIGSKEEVNYFVNGGVQMQTVPNVMLDETNLITGGVQIQEGDTVPNVQIDLGKPITNGEQQFDIPDESVRRAFVRKIFFILSLQFVILLPFIELFSIIFEEPFSIHTLHSIGILVFIFEIVMYLLRDMRRHPPMNLLTLAVLTIFLALYYGICACVFDSTLVFLYLLASIVQLGCLILFSKLERFRFSNINAILVIVIVLIVSIIVIELVEPLAYEQAVFAAAIHSIYVVCDTQLMLSGFHGYQLKSEEHIFAAANVFIDAPYCTWRVFKYFIVNPIVKLFYDTKACCRARVC